MGSRIFERLAAMALGTTTRTAVKARNDVFSKQDRFFCWKSKLHGAKIDLEFGFFDALKILGEIGEIYPPFLNR